jgi:hypothetical protein
MAKVGIAALHPPYRNPGGIELVGWDGVERNPGIDS